MKKDVKIYVVVISKDNELKKVKDSVKNLLKNGCGEYDIIVAAKKEEKIDNIELKEEEYSKEYKLSDEQSSEEKKKVIGIKEYCEKKYIEYYEYTDLKEIYYDMPNTLKYDFISFINSGDKYTKKFKSKLIKRIKEDKLLKNIYVCPIKYGEKSYSLNKIIEKGKNINIEKKPNKKWIHLNSVFISKNILKKIEAPEREDLKYYIEVNLLTKLIMINGGYGIIRNIKLDSINKFEDINEAKFEDYDIEWYKNIFNNIEDIKEFSKNKFGANLRYNQSVSVYLIKNIINENVNSKNKHILVNNKLESFWKKVEEVLLDVEDEIIMEIEGNKLVNYYLLMKKYGLQYKDVEYRVFEDKIHIVKDDKYLFDAPDTKIKIIFMDYKDEKLNIVARYPFPFNEEKLRIYVEYREEKFYAKKNPIYSDYKAFGNTVYTNYAFELNVPLQLPKNKDKKQFIKFYLESGHCSVKLDIDFPKPLARLAKPKYAYWNCGAYTLNYRKKAIQIMQNNKLRHLKREVKYIKSLLTSKNKCQKKAGLLRLAYHITKPFKRNDIWLFEDKIYKAGDNGEYLYTYASKQNDGIKKYYVLRPGTIDAKRFNKEKKDFVEFGSFKHKLLFLHSDIVFQTHINTAKQHSFDEKFEVYFRDLYNSESVCIQHGLTVQKIPDIANRINDNTKRYFLASKVEEENLKNEEYAYGGHEEIFKITGCPRYDGLKNNDQKQILITPTWRNYLAMPSPGYGKSRLHNNDFKQSVYFKIYNSLINDKKLIDTAEECGYKIVYLLHPCTSPQINDYDRNEYVELIAATDDLNYEKILTESSLMVTDYSGVQFDFAYMYKPIIYFHPDELPASYEEGTYKYETMALGEITKTIEQTVDLLCEYMRNNCNIKKEYKERIDNFFEFHDFNNCKRIYDEIMKYRDEEK